MKNVQLVLYNVRLDKEVWSKTTKTTSHKDRMHQALHYFRLVHENKHADLSTKMINSFKQILTHNKAEDLELRCVFEDKIIDVMPFKRKNIRIAK